MGILSAACSLHGAIGTAGVHASFGPSAYVMAFGRGIEGEDVNPTSGILVVWLGRPSRVESKIVMRPVGIR